MTLYCPSTHIGCKGGVTQGEGTQIRRRPAAQAPGLGPAAGVRGWAASPSRVRPGPDQGRSDPQQALEREASQEQAEIRAEALGPPLLASRLPSPCHHLTPQISQGRRKDQMTCSPSDLTQA